MRIVCNRSIAAMLTLLGAGLLPVALADPPADPGVTAPAAATAAAAAPAATSTSSTAATAASSNAAASSTAAHTAAASTAETDAALEKRLTNSGYKPRMRNGTKVWCKQQGELGSRLGGQEVCATPDEWRRAVRENQDVVEHIQRIDSHASGK
ncbi:MAG TPA: hypothetical protein VI195_06010 [Steroidobacteraceae bacterium]